MNRRTSLQRLSTRSPWKACKALGQDEGGRFTRVRRADAGSSPTASPPLALQHDKLNGAMQSFRQGFGRKARASSFGRSEREPVYPKNQNLRGRQANTWH